jgi:hypothetical protein
MSIYGIITGGMRIGIEARHTRGVKRGGRSIQNNKFSVWRYEV